MPNEDSLLAGRYQIVQLVGSGGFGEVYQAVDITSEQTVALKVGGTEAGALFRREAETLTRLKTSGVASVFDFGHLEDGRAFLVREWVPGRSLQERLQEGPLSEEEARRVIVRLAKALCPVHEAGLIHRDLKPSNIILRQGQELDPVLTDFGVAGFLEKNSHQTTVGQIFGTPKYMAPEQISGLPQSVETDIYALGLLFFEMIYGHLPYESSENWLSIFNKILNEPVILPSSPRVSSELKAVIVRCLEKERALRFSTVGALLDALSEPLAAPQISLDERGGEAEELSGAQDDDYDHDILPRQDELLVGAPQSPGVPSSSPPPDETFGASLETGAAIRVPKPRFSTARSEVERSSTSSWIVGLSVAAGVVGVLASILGLSDTWSSQENYGILDRLWVIPYIVLGLGLIAGGVVLGIRLRAWIAKKGTEAGDVARGVLFGARSRADLTSSLALEVDDLLARCQALDERLLGTSLAIMVKDFESLSAPNDRRAALVEIVGLIERLTERLSPWYVRYEKLLGAMVSLIGIGTGVLTILTTLLKSIGVM